MEYLQYQLHVLASTLAIITSLLDQYQQSRYLLHFPVSLGKGQSPHGVCTLFTNILDSFNRTRCIFYIRNQTL
jgi:hypothetical protein